MEKPLKQTVFLKVSVDDRLPSERGWYNLRTDGQPEACDRSWFDGKEFTLRNKCYDWKGLIANGFKLYWLEKQEDKIVLSQKEFEDALEVAFKAGREPFEPEAIDECGYKHSSLHAYLNQK